MLTRATTSGDVRLQELSPGSPHTRQDCGEDAPRVDLSLHMLAPEDPTQLALESPHAHATQPGVLVHTAKQYDGVRLGNVVKSSPATSKPMFAAGGYAVDCAAVWNASVPPKSARNRPRRSPIAPSGENDGGSTLGVEVSMRQSPRRVCIACGTAACARFKVQGSGQGKGPLGFRRTEPCVSDVSHPLRQILACLPVLLGCQVCSVYTLCLLAAAPRQRTLPQHRSHPVDIFSIINYCGHFVYFPDKDFPVRPFCGVPENKPVTWRAAAALCLRPLLLSRAR